ncbi:FMN-dependent NADH-azoreductase [Rugamonas sp. CCM 8940]|uniref:FMN-dependent NADH-azoreductase n=1 Tax=Rugamonas sp. CCM 8940 TaxID=2765359 RepID=UPI0018F51DB3|nr:NAD(P)H-dependent oxidoreductase [Rugamonas sp. CCM 8940]MBJ7309155.1 NAD(P)H-dependent oxidoreductase [Rugamonas sp. CCM 8940]
MTTLLHIACSPRQERSASREVALAYIDAYQEAHPGAQVSTLDLWDGALPEFDQHAMAAKYAGLNGVALSPQQESAWATLRALAARMHQADVLVLSVPLWNFSIPYKLKQFIDLVSQKDILFSFDPASGLSGLLRDKRAVVVYARGLDFSADSGTPAREFDFQKPYVEAWLRFVGVERVQALVVEKTLMGSEVDAAARDAAKAQARQLAAATAD